MYAYDADNCIYFRLTLVNGAEAMCVYIDRNGIIYTYINTDECSRRECHAAVAKAAKEFGHIHVSSVRNVSYSRLYKSNEMQWLRETNDRMEEPTNEWTAEMENNMPTVLKHTVFDVMRISFRKILQCIWCIRVALRYIYRKGGWDRETVERERERVLRVGYIEHIMPLPATHSIHFVFDSFRHFHGKNALSASFASFLFFLANSFMLVG